MQYQNLGRRCRALAVKIISANSLLTDKTFAYHIKNNNVCYQKNYILNRLVDFIKQ